MSRLPGDRPPAESTPKPGSPALVSPPPPVGRGPLLPTDPHSQGLRPAPCWPPPSTPAFTLPPRSQSRPQLPVPLTPSLKSSNSRLRTSNPGPVLPIPPGPHSGSPLRPGPPLPVSAPLGIPPRPGEPSRGDEKGASPPLSPKLKKARGQAEGTAALGLQLRLAVPPTLRRQPE